MVFYLLFLLLLSPPRQLSPQNADEFLATRLNRTKGHINIHIYGLEASRLPTIRMFARTDLTGDPAFQLDERGLFFLGALKCTWAGDRFRAASGSMVLEVLGGSQVHQPCPAEFPIKSFVRPGAEAHLYIEITRLSGSSAQTIYLGRPYYLNLDSFRSLSSDSGGHLFHIEPPLSSPPVLGIVEPPGRIRMIAGQVFRAPLTAAGTVLRREPRADAAVVGRALSSDDVVSWSLERGKTGAMVYGRSNGWSRLRLLDGRIGWVAPEDSGAYSSIEQLLRKNGAGLTTGWWDGKLSASPGGVGRAVVIEDPRRKWSGVLTGSIRTAGTRIPVFNSPDTGSNTEREETAVEEFESVDSQAGGIVVFERRPGWFRVGIQNSPWTAIRRVWIQERAGWSYRPLSAGESDRLVAEAWPDTSDPAIEIKEMRRINGMLWLRVEFLEGGTCEGIEEPRNVLASGWMPVSSAQGKFNLWFDHYCG